MADADLTLLIVDLSVPPDPLTVPPSSRHLIVGNKADLPRANPLACDVEVSALTGSGLAELRHKIRAAILPAGDLDQEPGFLTSLRHERLLRESLDSLARARVAVEENIPHEMLLLDLYAALTPIDAVTGATTADDILNRIFSTFCIGK